MAKVTNQQHQPTGTISSVQGQVAQVTFADHRPSRYDILTVIDDPSTLLQVMSSASPSNFFCFILNPQHRLARGTVVLNTQEALQIPVGDEVLGRAFDIFANPHDDGKKVESKTWRQMFATSNLGLADVKNPEEIIETGIKAIDFFTPILRGGKTALVGGAGVGKTVLLTAIMNRLVVQQQDHGDNVAVFSAVGERSREAQELYLQLKEAQALPFTSLVLGQMGENPALRFLTAYASATIAEHFRENGKNVLFFMDNMYRFAQAGHELSTLMSAIPSEDGYQPTLSSEVANLTERLISTQAASITSFLAVFVPSDDLTDHGVRALFPYLDSMVILSRDVFQAGRLPAIDLLRSISGALNPITIGQKHYDTYIDAKRILETANDLERIVSLIGESELSPDNQKIYRRAQLIQNYVTQDLFITAATPEEGALYVPRAQTVDDIAQIIDGRFDEVAPDKLIYIKSLSDVKTPAAATSSSPAPAPEAAPQK